MDEFLGGIALRLTGAPGVEQAVVSAALRDLGLAATPPDYLRFMAITNGGDGFLSDNGIYLNLYAVEQLRLHHFGYGFPEYAPNHVLIGCDGGGTSFSFCKRPGDQGVYAAELTSLADMARIAASFTDFLMVIRDGRWP